MYSADRHGHWDEEAFKDPALRTPGTWGKGAFLEPSFNRGEPHRVDRKKGQRRHFRDHA